MVVVPLYLLNVYFIGITQIWLFHEWLCVFVCVCIHKNYNFLLPKIIKIQGTMVRQLSKMN